MNHTIKKEQSANDRKYSKTKSIVRNSTRLGSIDELKYTSYLNEYFIFVKNRNIDPLSITSTNGGNQFILGKEWATKTNLKTDHEYDEHYKNYILAHNCIEELKKIFARTSGEGGVTYIDKIRDMSLISVPGNEPIEKKYQNRKY